MSGQYDGPWVDQASRNGDHIMFDEEDGCYRVPIPEDRQASVVAIRAVEEITGVDALEMDPSYDGYNFDVLEQVSDWMDVEEVDIEGGVTVTIAGHRVTYRSDGYLLIAPPP